MRNPTLILEAPKKLLQLQLHRSNKRDENFLCLIAVCPKDKPFKLCIYDKCLSSPGCFNHPTAYCRMNYCGGCVAEYFDKQNRKVDCSNGKERSLILQIILMHITILHDFTVLIIMMIIPAIFSDGVTYLL